MRKEIQESTTREQLSLETTCI